MKIACSKKRILWTKYQIHSVDLILKLLPMDVDQPPRTIMIRRLMFL